MVRRSEARIARLHGPYLSIWKTTPKRRIGFFIGVIMSPFGIYQCKASRLVPGFVCFPGSLVPFGTLSSIPQCIKKVNVSTLQKQGFSKVTFSRACWPLSVVACGDREDFLQFLRMLPSRGKATCAETAKKNHAEAEPLHERN